MGRDELITLRKASVLSRPRAICLQHPMRIPGAQCTESACRPIKFRFNNSTRLETRASEPISSRARYLTAIDQPVPARREPCVTCRLSCGYCAGTIRPRTTDVLKVRLSWCSSLIPANSRKESASCVAHYSFRGHPRTGRRSPSGSSLGE